MDASDPRLKPDRITRHKTLFAIYIKEAGSVFLDIAFEDLTEALKYKDESEMEYFKSGQAVEISIHKMTESID